MVFRIPLACLYTFILVWIYATKIKEDRIFLLRLELAKSPASLNLQLIQSKWYLLSFLCATGRCFQSLTDLSLNWVSHVSVDILDRFHCKLQPWKSSFTCCKYCEADSILLILNCIILCVGYPGHYPHNADCTWNIQAGFPDGIISTISSRLFLLSVSFLRKLYPKNLNLKKYSMWKTRI
jgi:hypothetical protein